MAELKTPGVIIRKINMGEADRLLTILTPEQGKIRAMAKGVRKPKAKLAAWLDMFRYNNLELASGRNFYIVTGAQTHRVLVSENTDWDRLAVAYYICEVVDKLIEEDHNLPGSFELVCESLLRIGEGEVDARLVRSSFEIKLLGIMGMLPQLHRCVVSGVPLDHEEGMAFSFRLGGVLSAIESTKDEFARPVTVNDIKLMRLLAQYPLGALEQVRVEESTIAEAANCISDFMAFILEKRPKSLNVVGSLEV
jgi:DNA repair protein RecO (recombination protein O)